MTVFQHGSDRSRPVGSRNMRGRMRSPFLAAYLRLGTGSPSRQRLGRLIGGDLNSEIEFEKDSSFTVCLPVSVKEGTIIEACNPQRKLD